MYVGLEFDGQDDSNFVVCVKVQDRYDAVKEKSAITAASKYLQNGNSNQ
jgi:hypothetical protein